MTRTVDEMLADEGFQRWRLSESGRRAEAVFNAVVERRGGIDAVDSIDEKYWAAMWRAYERHTEES